jgi:hypothetical protein
MLYGAPVWAEDVAKDKLLCHQLHEVQRRIAIRVCCGYRAIAGPAAMLLARVVSFELTALAYRRVYLEIRDRRLQDSVLTHRARELLRSRAKDTAINRWKDKFLKPRQTYEKRTLKAIMPYFHLWIERGRGGLSFHMTQALTGHGSFSTFLHRIRKANTSGCRYCASREDSPEHTL